MVKKASNYLLLAATCMIVALAGCKKQDFERELSPTSDLVALKANNGSKKHVSNEVATKWLDQELNLIKTTAGFTPPLASRALGYTGVTLYESVVESMPEYKSLQSVLGYTYTMPSYRPNEKFYWPAVANAALHSIIKNLFANATPSNVIAMENLYKNFHERHILESKKDDVEASEAYGRALAQSIYEWSKSDGIYKSFINYTPDQYTLPVFGGAWVPTAPGMNPLLPFWGENRPFSAMNGLDDCVPPPVPFPFSTNSNSDFYKQAIEVYQISKNMTSSQRDIALYWNDGGGSITPPGHNMNIATQMIRKNELTLNEAAIVYAKVGMAAADAFIACWKGKYKYNLMRPVTYIKQNIDANWNSLIPTPPFPAYSSGHATVSGATSVVLTSLFGDNVKFTDHTHESTFGTRQFNNFFHAAEEAAMSRLYGGIHFKMDNEIGLERGMMIGKNIANLKLKK